MKESIETKSRAELETEILTLKQSLPEPMVAPQVFATDTTPEALQMALAEQGERYAVISDEGNLFEILSGLYSDGRSNLDVFLQGHAGGTIRVKRKDRNVHLSRIAVSLGLAVQPQVLSDLKSNSKRSFRGKGLLARFLYCLPKSNIGTRDVRKRASVPVQVKLAYFAGIKSLLSVQRNVDANGVEVPLRLGLTPEALGIHQDFAEWIERQQGNGGTFESMQDFTGKLPGQALRIAGLCHVAKRATLSPLSPLSPTEGVQEMQRASEIDSQTISPVIDLCKGLIVHARAALDCLEGDLDIADSRWSLTWIINNAQRDDKGALFFKQNDLHSSSRFKKCKLDRVMKALNILADRHMISKQFKLATRKPTLIYYLNPAVLSNVG